MKQQHRGILDIIEAYLEENPQQRFGQALHNLKINRFANDPEPWKENFRMLDIYNDLDNSILDRAKLAIENDKKRK